MVQMAGCIHCGMPIDLDDPKDARKVRNAWFCVDEESTCAEDCFARMDFLHQMGYFKGILEEEIKE